MTLEVYSIILNFKLNLPTYTTFLKTNVLQISDTSIDHKVRSGEVGRRKALTFYAKYVCKFDYKYCINDVRDVDTDFI